MDSHDVENYFRQHRKTLAVVFLMVGMLAVSGFFMGMRQTERQITRTALPLPAKHEVAYTPPPSEIPPHPNTRRSPTPSGLPTATGNSPSQIYQERPPHLLRIESPARRSAQSQWNSVSGPSSL